MSEGNVDAPSVEQGWTAKVIFSAVTLACALGGVVWLNLYGKPDNSLHASTLSWCFMIIGGILLAFGVGSLSSLAALFAPKK